jgi:DNA-binding Lrp family transcriptional regulator
MDLIDRKILCCLDADCRTPIAQIAKRLRISRSVAAYRIQQLESQGIIRRYICSINTGSLGYTTYKIYFKIRTGADQEFVQHLLASKCVIHCLKTEGAYEYSISVAAKSILELDEFLAEIKSKFRDLIRDYTVSLHVYTKIFKLDKLLLGHAQLKMEQYASGKDAQIDEKDKLILRTLAQEANMPLVTIAQKTGLTVDIVKYRLKQLGPIIISNRIMIDMPKIGYHHYVIMLRTRATKPEEEKLVTWCRLKENVLYCSKRIGEFDFEVNAAIKDIDDLNAFLASLKEECGDIIDSHEIIINTKLLKLNYVPF